MRKTLRISVSGKVQGVWYRQHTLEKASALGLTGWVCNETDGSVTVMATGNPTDLDTLVEWCHQGSPRSRVSGVSVQECPLAEFKDFRIDRP